MKTVISTWALLMSVTYAFGDTLTGTVYAPSAKPLPAGAEMAKGNPGCPKEKASNHSIKVKNGRLENSFVYLKDVKSGAPPTETVALDQLGCEYHPHVIAIRVGQPLKILNSDNTMHNVHAISAKSQGFNEARAGGRTPIEKKFTKSEFIRFRCDIHGWMNAVVGVFEHPYYSITDKEGHFKIDNILPGEHMIGVWHEKLGEKEMKVKVVGTANVDFTF